MGVQIPHGKGYFFWGGRECPDMPDDALTWTVQNGWADRDSVWVIDSGGPNEASITWNPDPPCEGAMIRGKDMPGHARRRSAKIAEPIDLPLGLWTGVGRWKHKFNRIRQVAPMCRHGRERCRNLANTIELNRPPAVAMRLYVKLLWTVFNNYR